MPEQLKVGVHAPGYVAETTQEAADAFFPGFSRSRLSAPDGQWLLYSFSNDARSKLTERPP
jgi:hypothetical protein